MDRIATFALNKAHLIGFEPLIVFSLGFALAIAALAITSKQASKGPVFNQTLGKTPPDYIQPRFMFWLLVCKTSLLTIIQLSKLINKNRLIIISIFYDKYIIRTLFVRVLNGLKFCKFVNSIDSLCSSPETKSLRIYSSAASTRCSHK